MSLADFAPQTFTSLTTADAVVSIIDDASKSATEVLKYLALLVFISHSPFISK